MNNLPLPSFLKLKTIALWVAKGLLYDRRETVLLKINSSQLNIIMNFVILFQKLDR